MDSSRNRANNPYCDGSRRRGFFDGIISCFRRGRFFDQDSVIKIEKITEREELEKQANMLRRQLEHIENLLKENNR